MESYLSPLVLSDHRTDSGDHDWLRARASFSPVSIFSMPSVQSYAMVAAGIVGLTGLLPLVLLPLIPKSKHAVMVHCLLTASCGALLANALVHIYPEALLLATGSEPRTLQAFVCPLGALLASSQKTRQLSTHGYLIILLNMLDNVAHGMTLSAAFAVSPRVGTITAIAIVVHEIPHEIGDYAILVNAGINMRLALAGQLVTSFGGVLGVLLAGRLTSPMLSMLLMSFTAGGFLYISLASLAPQLVASAPPLLAARDAALLIAGASTVALLGCY